jgi:SOS-response transcriptional repressor LexA
MTTAAPTPRQRELVRTIAELTAANGYAPTFREIGRRWNCHWTNVAALARKCRARGLLVNEHGRARSWRVAK